MTIDNDDEFDQLDEELIEQFSAKLEKAINSVIKKHKEKDSRVELLTVLVSFASQVAQDAGMSAENFEEFAMSLFEQLEGTSSASTNTEEQNKYGFN